MGKTIMVVDDNADIILSMKIGLEDKTKDYQVIGVESGKECLNHLLQHQPPDLIILDIMMPEMSGWETLNKLKENKSWKKIPVVFLTARIDDTARTAGKFLGEDYIEKPFDIQDVKNRVYKVLERKGSETL